MKRILLGGIVGGILIFATGFATFGVTSLYYLSYNRTAPENVTVIQDVLREQLGSTGTGAYAIPDPKQEQTENLLERGPQATVFYQEGGLGHPASNSPIGGFFLCILTGLLLAAALGSTASRTTWGDRVKLVVLFALAFTVYRDLGEPIFNAYGWTFFVVQFVQDMVALVIAGLVIGRWFVPPRMAAAATSQDHVADSHHRRTSRVETIGPLSKS